MYDSPNSVSTLGDGPPGQASQGIEVLGCSTPQFCGKYSLPLTMGPLCSREREATSLSVKQSSLTAPPISVFTSSGFG